MCDKCVEWGGVLWHRYNGGYYERTVKSGVARIGERLHRAVWASIHGPIPSGMEVHHRDGDKGNNDIRNLEILAKPDHMRHHRAGKRPPNNDWKSPDAGQRPCADCGALVERQRTHVVVCKRCQQKRADANRTKIATCKHCGAQFKTIRGNFCSQRCVNLATRGGTVRVLPQGLWRA